MLLKTGPGDFVIVSGSLTAEEFIQKRGEIPIVDVRTPAEYNKGHIPGSVNIPLFEDDERARVGTIYKREGKDAAVLEGLKITGPRMADYVTRSRDIAPTGEILVYCWRGGMRSGSFSWLLETSGLKSRTLSGGYKSYRRLVQSSFEPDYPMIVLGGETGSGKTEVLHELRKRGEQVIDLEGLANHRGSSFGAMGLSGQPQTEQFENLLFEALRKIDGNRRVWVEDESKSIGRVYIPDHFLKTMKSAPVIRISIPREVRIRKLVNLYGNIDQSELEGAIERIRRRLGGKDTDLALLNVREGNLNLAADIILRYYDGTYLYSLEKRTDRITTVESVDGDPARIADDLIAMAESKKEIQNV